MILLEDTVVSIARAAGSLTFPTNFMLVAATPALRRTPRWVPAGVTSYGSFSLAGQCGASVNPCPCGYAAQQSRGDPVRECTCSLTQVLRYQKRISGPLLDRIDIHIDVPRMDYEKLAGDRLGESSAQIQARVERARERQRFAGTALQCNGDMGPAEVRQCCGLDETGKRLLRLAMS